MVGNLESRLFLREISRMTVEARAALAEKRRLFLRL